MRVHHLVLLPAALLLAACGPDLPGDNVSADDPLGVCSIAEAMDSSRAGVAVYSDQQIQYAGAPNGGAVTRALSLYCSTPGPYATDVAIVLPFVRDGAPADTGSYQIAPTGTGNGTHQVAWAFAQLNDATASKYHAAGGTVRITGERGGLLEGAYEIALTRDPTADPRYPERIVLWGAFRAPRQDFTSEQAPPA